MIGLPLAAGSRLLYKATRAIVLGCLVFVISTANALATERLTEAGALLAAMDVETTDVTVTRMVDVGGDRLRGTFVTAHTASGKALQRNHLGYWVPWDGRVNNLADNHFKVSGGQVLFKVLKDEDMSAELFPIRIT
ncbi:MAG: hypothetical protein CMM47_07915, partial [Rhodospirillaceae bacterium]|nr:hypothetical protein [Rhodospirillaceae bacterium]